MIMSVACSYILCLETSTTYASAALVPSQPHPHTPAHTPIPAITRTASSPRSHARELPRLLDHMLKDAACSFSQLSAAALSAGPGSFTGLRIGTATIKALCLAHQLPLLALSTPQALAAAYLHQHNNLDPKSRLLVLLPQKGATYVYALYDANLTTQLPPRMERPDGSALKPYLSPITPLHLLMPPEAPFPDAFASFEHLVTKRHPLIPHASHLVSLAQEAFAKKSFVSLHDFAPHYASLRWTTASPPIRNRVAESSLSKTI